MEIKLRYTVQISMQMAQNLGVIHHMWLLQILFLKGADVFCPAVTFLIATTVSWHELTVQFTSSLLILAFTRCWHTDMDLSL